MLFNKTKLIGTFILISVLVNVIVFDIFFLDKYGALAGAILYLILLLIIVFINKETVVKVFKELVNSKAPLKKSPKERVFKYVIVLVLIGLLFIGDQLLVGLFGHGKG